MPQVPAQQDLNVSAQRQPAFGDGYFINFKTPDLTNKAVLDANHHFVNSFAKKFGQNQLGFENTGQYSVTHINDPKPRQFPKEFKPREAKNMDHCEKVKNWMKKVPIFKSSNDVWFNYCYPGTVDSDDEIGDDTGYSFGLDADIIEYQAQQLTKCVKKLYALEDVSVNDRAGLTTASILNSENSDSAYFIR